MINSDQKRLLLEKMVELLELPDSAYEKAKDRYEDIGEYLGREASSCHHNDPYVFPQGSFRLGTAIRPLNESEEYDLDLACNLSKGITQDSHTQAQLKKLIGDEIKSYREARNIKAPVEEKHRCWRLEYEDHLSFHMDIVPCIPADKSRRNFLTESMVNAGLDRPISEDASRFAVSITDDRHPHYRQISHDWNPSNPEGYARWFVSRMRITLALMLEKAQVDELPIYKRKTPLQRSIQLLKRHRDQMFKDDQEVKPISIIITTIAARAYRGQHDLVTALEVILDELDQFAKSGETIIRNPVNPQENFADRWTMDKYKHLRLRDNFEKWVTQAKADFALLSSTPDVNFIAEQTIRKFAVKPSAIELAAVLGLSVGPEIHIAKAHELPQDTAKPWCI